MSTPAPQPVAAAPVGPPKMIVLPERLKQFGQRFTSVGALGTGLTILFYTSLTLFILFLILTFIHFTIYPVFSFSEGDDGIISIPTSSDRQKAFTGVVAMPDVSANFVAIPNCSYTISFDTYLNGDFFATNAPRVLLYRARVPVAMNSGDREESLLDRFQDTNLLVYLDPLKNDLNVAIATSDGTAARKTLQMVAPITNVPMRKVFRTSIVFTETFVEVYINGNLEQSMPLTQKPISQDAKFDFYTTPAMFGGNVRVANMVFWPRPLKSRDVRANGAPVAPDTLFSPVKT
jgi:hypothetical protein